MRQDSALEMLFTLQLKAAALSHWVTEYRFAPPRRWRFDFAWPHLKFAVDIGAGFIADPEKYNHAMMRLGWIVLRFPGGMVKRGEAITLLERALQPMDGPYGLPGKNCTIAKVTKNSKG